MNMLRRISFPLLLATTILSAVVLTSMALRADDGSLLQIGDTMPAFSVLPLGATDSLRSAELRGKPCAIVFFDSGCYDCRKALPRVERMQHEFPNVRFLCIAREQQAPDVETYWKQEGLTLTWKPRDIHPFCPPHHSAPIRLHCRRQATKELCRKIERKVYETCTESML